MKSKEKVILLVAWFNIFFLGGCNHHEDKVRILETDNARLSSRIASMAVESTAAEARLDEAKLHAGKTERALEDSRAAVLKAEAEIFALKMQVTRLTRALQDRENLPFPSIPVPREPPG